MERDWTISDDFEVYPPNDDDEYWGNDDFAPSYDEELDFDNDPMTEYLPEDTDLEDDEDL